MKRSSLARYVGGMGFTTAPSRAAASSTRANPLPLGSGQDNTPPRSTPRPALGKGGHRVPPPPVDDREFVGPRGRPAIQIGVEMLVAPESRRRAFTNARVDEIGVHAC